jgi:uncharacterized protein (TIGR02145 family)
LISGTPSSGVEKLSIQSLTDNIVNGRITNTSSNQGIFLIPQIDYDSYSVWERNFRFVINAFNQYDNAVYSGEFFTGNISIPSPMGAAYNPNGCYIGNAGTIIETITGLTFQVGDEIEENFVVDNTNDVIKWKVLRNGVEVVDKIYNNTIVSVGSRMFYVFGMRFSNPSPGYNSKCTFIFDGSYIKGDGQLLWGLDTSSSSAIIGGKRYKTVVMPDGKEWLAENLDFKFCNIGGGGTSTTANAWHYDNDESTYGWNGYKCGLLYNWYAAKVLNDHRSELCPGWHVPTKDEWDALATACGGDSVAGTKLKSLDGSAGAGFPSSWNGTDEYGFSALPTGYYNGSIFNGVGSASYFWTATEYNSSRAYDQFFSTGASSSSANDNKTDANPIRLVRDT